MIVTLQTYWLSVTDVRNYLDRGKNVLKRKAFPIENPPIAVCMQIAESVREFDFLAIDRYGTVGSGPARFRCGRQVIAVQRQEPPYPGAGKFEEPSRSCWLTYMHNVLLHLPEYPREHVEKMHANIRSNTA